MVLAPQSRVVERVDDQRPGRGLLGGGDGVLEVEEHEVGVAGGRFGDHLLAGAGRGQLGAAKSRGHCVTLVRSLRSQPDLGEDLCGVFAEPRRPAVDPRRCGGQLDRRPGSTTGRLPSGCAISTSIARALDVRVGEDVVGRLSPARPGTRPASVVDDLGGGPRRCPVRQRPADERRRWRPVRGSSCVRSSSIRSGRSMISHSSAQWLSVGAAMAHGAVRGREDVERGQRRMAVARRPADLPGVGVAVDDRFAEREHGVVHGDVEELALAGARGVHEGGDDADRGERAG